MSKRLTQPLNYLLFDSEDTVFKENQILTFVQQYPKTYFHLVLIIIISMIILTQPQFFFRGVKWVNEFVLTYYGINLMSVGLSERLHSHSYVS